MSLEASSLPFCQPAWVFVVWTAAPGPEPPPLPRLVGLGDEGGLSCSGCPESQGWEAWARYSSFLSPGPSLLP